MHVPSLFVTLGAIVASAQSIHLTGRAIGNVLKRDIPGLPSGCVSRCGTANTIYDACVGGDMDTCLSICEPSTSSAYQDCLQCVVDQAPSNVRDQLQQGISQIESLCADTGSGTASGSAETVSYDTASPGYNSGGGYDPASSSRLMSSPTSPPANGGQSSGPSAGSNAQPSVVETSGSAGVAIKLPNMIGCIVALLGVGAGAALLF